VRRAFILVGVLLAAAVFVPLGTAARRAAAPQPKPTINIKYTMNCTFSIQDDNGNTLTNIAPGTYQIFVSTPEMFKLVRPGGVGVDNIAANDFTGCKGWVQFQVQGPGVNLFTTLDSGCDAYLLLPQQTFKAGQYVFQDLNQPGTTRQTISVQPGGYTWVPAKNPYDVTSGKGSTQKDLIGSESGSSGTKVLGTLSGSVSARGGLTSLKLNGKPVKQLKHGRYKLAINDMSKTASFEVKALAGTDKGLNKDLTDYAFVGRHTVWFTFTPGRWVYSTGVKSKQNYVLVTS